MKNIFLTILATTIFLRSFGQKSDTFEIKEVYVTDSSQLKYPSDFERKDSIFFQDDKYIVRATCHGEWGGSVWFKNKNTKKEYSCRASCPYFVNKIGSKYYVTTNYFHMAVSTEVIEIDDPELMDIYDPNKVIKIDGHVVNRAYPKFETDSYKGSKTLAWATDIYTAWSFTNQDKLYQLMTRLNGGEVRITTIQNNKFVTVDTIPGSSSYNIWDIVEKDNHLLVFFFKTKIVEKYMSVTHIANGCLRGYIDIFGNKITIYRYDKLLALDKGCR
ncbi:MAG TPA: hypothetical protein VKH37_10995 [Ferruginibacter sp.]|nr:hypothetical protein [Ferruginibacter sp.]